MLGNITKNYYVKVKTMRLLYYNKGTSIETFSIDDCSSLLVLSCLEKANNLQIKSFYGNKDDVYFETSDVLMLDNVGLLQSYLAREEEDLIVNDLSFNLDDGSLIAFDDDYDCTLQFRSDILSSEFFEKLMIKLGYDADKVGRILLDNTGKYVLINHNSELVKSFLSFDDYLEYDS